MEPNKFDNNIKETLKNRRLHPSKESWNKLSQRLESQNKKQNNKAIWFVAVAASLAGLLFVAFQFFNTKEITPVITDSPVIKIQENRPIASEKETVTNDGFTNEHSKKQLLKATTKIVSEAMVLPKESQHSIKSSEEVAKSISVETQKIETIVAHVNDLKNNHQTVTSEYIEALLNQAEKEIRMQKLQNGSAKVVDASLLLQQVETDLDQSFRSKVFEAIKASYTTMKTVVAQRNN